MCGIDPLHLAIIFLANLELGYLTPPMERNLFLAGVLVITYVPWLTLGPVKLLLR